MKAWDAMLQWMRAASLTSFLNCSIVDLTMRFTITRLIVLTAVLLIPASIRLAHSAEIEPSKSTHCTFDPDRLRLLPAVPRSPVTFDMLTAEQANRAQKIAALIQAKQWNPAFQEFQQTTYWVQNITLRPLLAALVQAKADTAFGNLQLMPYQISDIAKEFEQYCGKS